MRVEIGENRLRAVWLLIAAGVLAACLASGITLGFAGRFDFCFFYRDARHLLGGGDMADSRNLEWYLPGMRIAILWLGAIPMRVGVLAWNAINVLAVVATMAAMLRLARQSHGIDTADDRRNRLGVACLLVAPVAYNVFQFNQVSFWPLALILWAYVFALRRSEWVAGGLLGLAIFVKLMPGLLLGWCILRHRWRMALVAVLLPIVLSPGIDMAAYGLERTWHDHEHWLHVAVARPAGTGFADQGKELDHKNEGLAVVLTRLLQPTPTVAVRSISLLPARRVRQVNIAECSDATVRLIYRALIGSTAIGLLAVTLLLGRECQSTAFQDAEHAIFAIWCLSMMWFAPLMRVYYLVWALPAVWMLIELGWRPDGNCLNARKWAGLGIAAWIVGLLGWASPEARAMGINQWVNLAMALAIIVLVRQRTGNPLKLEPENPPT